MKYTDEERRQILVRAYATLVRLDAADRERKFGVRGQQRDERRHQKQPEIIYKTIMNARIDKNGRRL